MLHTRETGGPCSERQMPFTCNFIVSSDVGMSHDLRLTGTFKVSCFPSYHLISSNLCRNPDSQSVTIHLLGLITHEAVHVGAHTCPGSSEKEKHLPPSGLPSSLCEKRVGPLKANTGP